MRCYSETKGLQMDGWTNGWFHTDGHNTDGHNIIQPVNCIRKQKVYEQMNGQYALLRIMVYV